MSKFKPAPMRPHTPAVGPSERTFCLDTNSATNGVREGASTSAVPLHQNGRKRLSSDFDELIASRLKRPKTIHREGLHDIAGGRSSHYPEPYIISSDEEEPAKPNPVSKEGTAAPLSSTHKDHHDLFTSPTQRLQELLIYNHKLNRIIMDDTVKYYSSGSKKGDIVTLKDIKNILSARISAIEGVLDSQSSHPNTTPALAFLPSGAPTSSTFGGEVPGSQSSSLTVYPPTDDYLHESLTVGAIPETENNFSTNSVHVDTPVPLTGPNPNSYSKEAEQKLAEVFGLQDFRTNQMEAINATMAGRDVFVLMPTGGGKSLCYQLPAICSGGTRGGVTVVISPLLSLMKDQVHALTQKDIDVVLWNSTVTNEEVKNRLDYDPKPRLLYVTPEKLVESYGLRQTLLQLYRNNELARFVIDEAHCISTWGQDFRDAYKDLGRLRKEYPDVPIMALTATANQVTIDDVMKQLQLRDCVVLKQSFNRPNLQYYIRAKKKNIIRDIADFIKTKYPKETGVIYCLGRDKCERVAKALRENELDAKHYHARISDDDKDQVLEDWRSGKCKIIVATIAFGMGIDKADVRYVIHHDLPKSLDGYYQETGRAGRDGHPSDCILYYNYQDFQTIVRMIRTPDKERSEPPSMESMERQEMAARSVVEYCQNRSDCRRVQLLQYFSERFDRKDCMNGCDNCSDSSELTRQNVTATAHAALGLVKALQARKENVTMTQCRAILRGSKTSDIREKGHDKLDSYGKATDMPTELLEQLFQQLLFLELLVGVSLPNASGFHNQYIELGPPAKDFMKKRTKMELLWRPSPKTPKANPGPSTRKRRQTTINADAMDFYEEDSACGSEAGEPLVGRRTNIDTPKARKMTHLKPLPSTKLFDQLFALRHQLAGNLSIEDNEVLDDSTLELLSQKCPQDYLSFEKIMVGAKGIASIKSSSGTKLETHGSEFLEICMAHRVHELVRSNTAPSTFNASVLHSRYDYQERENMKPQTIPARLRSVKFKPKTPTPD